MNLQPLRAGLLCVIVACSPGALVAIYSTRRVASLSLSISVVRVILTACPMLRPISHVTRQFGCVSSLAG